MTEKKQQTIGKMKTDPAGTTAEVAASQDEPDRELSKEGPPEVEEPLMRIARELVRVVHGAGAPDLRRLVEEVFPADPVEAAAFNFKLTRLKIAAEAVAQTGQDMYGRLMSK